MGDLLQATPLMAALKKKYPNIELDVLVGSDFASIAKSIPNIDKIKILNLRQFTPSEYKGELTIVRVYRYVEKVIDELKEAKYDTVINLSHSKLSAVMTSLINVKDIRGITSNETGNRMVKHPWLRYFANIIFNRDYNSFNMVDIYLKSGDAKATEDHLFFNIDKKSTAFAEELLSQEWINTKDFLVGFQPGSSLKGRRWSATSFANLGNVIVNELEGKVVLFGVESEADLGQEVKKIMEEKGAAAQKVVNLAGKTSIRELAALVKRCDVLVTNDTGTMHIAAAVGTRVVGLFFAHAYPVETGAYGQGNIFFQANIPCSPCSYGVVCNNVVCVEYVTVDHVFRVLKLIKDKKIDAALFENDSDMEKIKIFRTNFDREHILEFLPVIKKPLTKRDFFCFIYRMMWKTTLDPSSTLHKDGENNIVKRLKTYYNLGEFSKIYPELKSVLEDFNKLWQISKQASNYAEELIQSSSLNPPHLNKIEVLGNKITGLDEEISLMGYVSPTTKPIIDMFRLGKENLQGDVISILAEETLILYQNIKKQAGTFFQLGTKLCESLKQSFDSSQ